jgi:radical SAM protein with 4Fe4S-binding SPASM domain
MMKRFKKMYIEITNRCNLTCDFCPQSSRSAQTMTTAFFQSVLEKIKPYTDYLYFHVMGEPLMHPDLETMLDVSFEHGFKVNLTTNGTLIKRIGPNIIQKQALRQINFSLHSCLVNESKGADIGEYLTDILDFAKTAFREKGPIICMRLWNVKENGDVSANRDILERIGREFDCVAALSDHAKLFDGVKIADRIFLNCAVEFDWPGLDKNDIGDKGFCLGLRDQLAILADGTVVPCCLDAQGEIDLGNIMEQTLEDILQERRTRALYDGFSKRMVVEKLCRTCGYRKRFDRKSSYLKDSQTGE